MPPRCGERACRHSCLQEIIAGTRDQAGDAEVDLQAVGPETMTHPWGLKVK